jgi:hypothetical protein
VNHNLQQQLVYVNRLEEKFTQKPYFLNKKSYSSLMNVFTIDKSKIEIPKNTNVFDTKLNFLEKKNKHIEDFVDDVENKPFQFFSRKKLKTTEFVVQHDAQMHPQLFETSRAKYQKIL